MDGGKASPHRGRDCFVGRAFSRMEEHLGSGYFTRGWFPLLDEVTQLGLLRGRSIDHILVCHVFRLVRRAAYPMEEHLSKFLWSSTRLAASVSYAQRAW